jgi:hypothetical protein
MFLALQPMDFSTAHLLLRLFAQYHSCVPSYLVTPAHFTDLLPGSKEP